MKEVDLTGIGVLWDMDGVLVDTGEFHFQSWQGVLAEAGIAFDRERFRQTFGMNNLDMITTLLGRQPEEAFVQEMGDRKEHLFRQSIAGRARLLAGAGNWLAWLQAQGASQAIASSAPCENIDALVDELDIRPYFVEIVSGTGMPGKPNPAVFLTAARLLGLPPEKCLVIEDSIAGVTAAKRAGMRCLAVTTTNPAKALQQADWILEGLDTRTPSDLLFNFRARIE